MSKYHKAPRYVVLPIPLMPCPSQAQIFFSTLFLNTVSLHSSLNVRDEISRPYKTTAKITVNKLGGGSALIDSKNIHRRQRQQYNKPCPSAVFLV